MAPTNYEMLRESDPRVESYHTSEAVLGTKTTFAVFAPVSPGKKLPVVLFQTGYGSTSISTAPQKPKAWSTSVRSASKNIWLKRL